MQSRIYATRRRFLRGVVGIASVSLTVAGGRDTHAATPGVTGNSSLAIEKLKAGNQRCINGDSVHGHDVNKWRERFLNSQKPFATILGCSDSRVPPELIFDQGFGELFVIRVAGNIVDPAVIASVEYSIAHLDNKLVVVLGHQNCGAVTAALKPKQQTSNEPPELQSLLQYIRPAIEKVDDTLPAVDRLSAAIKANVRNSVAKLSNIPTIANAIEMRNVQVVGAICKVDSGETNFLSS